MRRPCRSSWIAVVVVAVIAAWSLFWSLKSASSADAPHGHEAPASILPAEAMRRLHDGNERFVAQKEAGEHKDAARRGEVAKGQHPFAVVLGCADSRVPPELVFDQGLGDLFVIRVAGEVAPPEVIGSIEYAVEHLGCRAIVVLGHEKCGAVDAALAAAGGPEPEGNLGQLIKDILPAVDKIDKKSPDALDHAVRANAKAVAETITVRSKMLAEMAHKGEIVITPARYDLDTGEVEFMDNLETK